jgi:hypothetical protein
MKKVLKQFFIKCIETLIEWLETNHRELKTKVNLDEEISKYHKAAEELDPQLQPEITENGVFGEDGWYIEIRNPIVDPNLDKLSDRF